MNQIDFLLGSDITKTYNMVLFEGHERIWIIS